MTFFKYGFQGSLGIFIIGLSLLNFLVAIRIGNNLRHSWAEFQREPLQPWQKNLIDRAAFFIGIPLGVVVHELSHAALIYLFGGKVIDAGYGFYWGYVVPSGTFTPAENWLISLAGTIGSLLYGIGVWLLLRKIPISSYRYFGLRVLRIHLIYSLIYYPLFTALTFVGDWRIIYLDSPRILAGITLVFHVASLIFLWWSDQRGLYEMPGFSTVTAMKEYEALRGVASSNPADPQIHLSMVDAYQRSGMPHTARHALQQYLKRFPDSAEAQLEFAILRAQNKREVPSSAADHARKALDLGLSNPRKIAVANQIAGRYSLGAERLDQAIGYFSDGLETLASQDQKGLQGQLYYWRAVAYRRRGEFDLARVDIERAIDLERGANNGEIMSRYEAERSVINTHAGQRSGSGPYSR